MKTFKITIWKFRKTLHVGKFQFNTDGGAYNYALGLYEGIRIMGGEPTGMEVKEVKVRRRTLDKIITDVDCKYGAPMGRRSIGDKPEDKRVYDCAVPMSGDGAYDKGGAYWGIGPQLRVSYTKDLSYVEFYRR